MPDSDQPAAPVLPTAADVADALGSPRILKAPPVPGTTVKRKLPPVQADTVPRDPSAAPSPGPRPRATDVVWRPVGRAEPLPTPAPDSEPSAE